MKKSKNKITSAGTKESSQPEHDWMHINQFIAHTTGISRRDADKEIAAKKVYINGKIALPPDRVRKSDEVKWKGKVVRSQAGEAITVVLNKPVGYVCSRLKDETGAPTIMELLPKEFQQLKPIGRLDKDSEGLILLTNDGDLLYRSTHPKFEIEKEYEITFEAVVHDNMISAWERGIKLREGIAKADKVTRVGRKQLRVIIHQGMNRQLRRMAAETKNTILSLRRIRSGETKLGNLEPGAWKQISGGK